MSIKEKLMALQSLPAPLMEQKGGTLGFEAVIAERKSFLNRKKLTYRCCLRISDSDRKVRFYEVLKESGFGISGGGGFAGGASPGFSFKKETYSTFGKERSGSIEEQSKLFGKDYSYAFDYAAVRNAVRAAAEEEGYALEVCLLERNLKP